MASDAPASSNNASDAAGPDVRPQGVARRADRAMIAALVVYVVLTAVVAVPNSDRINPDGVAYVRNALYLAEGRLLDSASGYWSPLLSWCLVPFLATGMDALDASRVVLALWGVVLVLGATRFVRCRTAIGPPWDTVALLLIGLAASQWVAATDVTPDAILGALLIWYFYFVATPSLLVSRRSQVAAGLLGGLAYLAKSYAFPFFLAHYTLSLAVHYFSPGSAATRRQALAAWGTGLLAFGLIAGPWIGLLTAKYGAPTVTRATALNHYIIGPPDKETNYEVLYRAQPVPTGRITVWETPEDLDFDDWSPFASTALLLHQVKHVVRNGERIIEAIARFDLLSVVPGFLVLMPVVRRAATRRGGAGGCPTAWLLMTVLLFAGGFLPIAFEPRYVEPVLWPLCCVAVFAVLSDVQRLLEGEKVAGPRSRAVLLVGLLCALSLAAPPVKMAAVALWPGTRQHADRCEYREYGYELASEGCPGPVAACPGNWHAGLYVAYRASLPFLGEVQGDSPEQIEKSLEQFGARAFVASTNWPLYKEFARRTTWKKIVQCEQPRGTLRVFVPPAEKTP